MEFLLVLFSKDRELNNLPICGKRNRTIVPLRQDLIKHDAHRLLEMSGHFAACFIDLVENLDKDVPAGLRVGLLHQFLDERDARENHALAGSGHMRE